MATTKPRSLLRIEYEEAAEAYLRSLPPEHFMEATPQSTQREIVSESFALVKAYRPEVQYFNELLVQYPYGRSQRIRQVVPDTMVIIHPEPIKAVGSYDLPFQPVRPFWMLEYVSKHSKRKDYDESFHKYERELRIPYYLLFYPDNLELTLYSLRHGKYKAMRPNAAGRLTIRRLEMEMAIQDGWVRFWFRGELLPLPGEQLRVLHQTQEVLAQKEQELQRMRAQLEALGVKPAE